MYIYRCFSYMFSFVPTTNGVHLLPFPYPTTPIPIILMSYNKSRKIENKPSKYRRIIVIIFIDFIDFIYFLSVRTWLLLTVFLILIWFRYVDSRFLFCFRMESR